MANILIVDDEADIRFSLRGILEDEGYTVLEADSGERALELLPQADLIFLDIWMPEARMDGLQVLEIIQSKFAELPVVMISGHANIETAVQAIKMGAYDFIEKPLSLEKILVIVKKALELSRLRLENKALRASVSPKITQLTGISQPIQELKRLIAQVAPTDTWVLITGENGTGKEIVARSIHAQSKRANKPLVAVNCAAIPEELIESELFGHKKGAFTGAVENKIGKFALAHEGTLFLDEIGDMSLKTQAKILRILQEQRFEPVGDNKTIQVSVRVIAATNKNLEQEIEKGNFRQDLYFRLNVFPLNVPPLRKRVEDIPLLLEEFVQLLSQEHNFKPLKFAKEALAALVQYPWPGNVRELKNFVERMFILYAGQEVGLDDLPPEFKKSGQSNFALNQDWSKENSQLTFKEARSEFERRFLAHHLKLAQGNISELSRQIGLERTYLYKKLKNYNLI